MNKIKAESSGGYIALLNSKVNCEFIIIISELTTFRGWRPHRHHTAIYGINFLGGFAPLAS